jgi:predicted HAD superfamily Cof-like phosphohydrolase
MTMTSNFQKVCEFHRAFTQSQLTPTESLIDFRTCSLRIHLIDEELKEYMGAETEVDRMDALADLLYVVYGAGVVFGIDLDYEYDHYLQPQVGKTPIHHFPRGEDSVPSQQTSFEKTCAIYWRFDQTQFITQMVRYLRDLAYWLLMRDVGEITMMLVQMLHELYEIGYTSHIQMDRLFEVIHLSNMSKLCSTEAEAKATVQWYQEHESNRYPQPTYGRSRDGVHWVVFDQVSGGKVLKSYSYTPPTIVVSDLMMV